MSPSILRFVIAGLAVCSMSVAAVSQSVQGRLSADSARLEILKVLPDSFPQVTLIVRAEKHDGEPLWNMKKERVTMTENGQPCNVISVAPISKQLPFNIAMVLDHSSSMTDEIVSYYGYQYRVTNYVPINSAKNAISKFAASFPNHDKMAVVGFSTYVDIVTPLTNNHDSLVNVVSNIYADGITAFYDAVDRALDVVQADSGIRVIVALTDGNDNNSRRSLGTVIAKAQRLGIPVFVVGLGEVEVGPLKRLASKTNGQYFYAKRAGALDKVYEVISQRLKAYYAIAYESDNYSQDDTLRMLTIGYQHDSIPVTSDSDTLALPTSVRAYLAQRAQNRNYLIGGGITALAVGTTLFVVIRRRRKKQPEAEDTNSIA